MRRVSSVLTLAAALAPAAAAAGVTIHYDGVLKSIPFGRMGLPEEVANVALFLASPYARFVSGHTLVVDGANWQRRSMTNPPVVTIRDQMGRGTFALEQ